jgi:hypothetical protein
MEEHDHETLPVERWPDEVTRDDHVTPPAEPWPPEVTRDDHVTLDDV